MRRFIMLAMAVFVTGCAETNEAWHDTTHNLRGYRTYSEPTYDAKMERMLGWQDPTPRYADTVFGMYASPKIEAEDGIEVTPVRPPPRTVRREVTAHRQLGMPTRNEYPDETAGGGRYYGGSTTYGSAPERVPQGGGISGGMGGGGMSSSGGVAQVDDVEIHALDDPTPLTP